MHNDSKKSEEQNEAKPAASPKPPKPDKKGAAADADPESQYEDKDES